MSKTPREQLDQIVSEQWEPLFRAGVIREKDLTKAIFAAVPLIVEMVHQREPLDSNDPHWRHRDQKPLYPYAASIVKALKEGE